MNKTDRATKIAKQIDRLKAELLELQPMSALTVRQIAKRAGISPATASRVKNGATPDVETARKLMAADLLVECPVCGGAINEQD